MKGGEDKKRVRAKQTKKSDILHMRISPEDKELVGKLTVAMDEPSDSQTIIKLIRKEARERGLLD